MCVREELVEYGVGGITWASAVSKLSLCSEDPYNLEGQKVENYIQEILRPPRDIFQDNKLEILLNVYTQIHFPGLKKISFRVSMIQITSVICIFTLDQLITPDRSGDVWI